MRYAQKRLNVMVQTDKHKHVNNR